MTGVPVVHVSLGNFRAPGGIEHRCSCGWVSRPHFSNMSASADGVEHRDAQKPLTN